MRSLRVLCALLALAFPSVALAQSVLLQGGPFTAGHMPMYSGTGSGQPVVIDGGTAAGGGTGANISEIGVVARGTGTAPYAGQGRGPLGTNVCDYDAPITNVTGYHYFCVSANAQGGGLLTYGAGGGAAQLPLKFVVNGVSFAFPGGFATLTIGTTAVAGGTNGNCLYNNAGVLGDLPCASTAITSLTGDVTAVGPGAAAATLATVNVSPGSFGSSVAIPSFAVDAKGRLTTATNNPVIAPAGTLTGTILATNVITSSLTAVGTIGVGVWNGTIINVAHGGTGLASGTSGGILAYTASGVLASSAALTLDAPVIGGGAGAVPTVGGRSGNTTTFGTTAGVLTNGNCVSIDSDHNLIDAGGPCTTGGGGGTVSSATGGQIAAYPSTGTTVGGETVSGDCTHAVGGAWTCTKTGGVAFATSATTDTTNAGNISAGTLAVARGGSGAGTFTANAPLLGNGTSAFAVGTRSGSTTAFATVTGTLTNGHCVSIDASGNFIDNGSACSAATGTMTAVTPGGGTVSSITASCSQTAITVTGTLSAAECVNAQTGTTYAIADGDRGKLVTASNAAAQAYSIAQAGAASAFQTGWYADVRNKSTNAAGIVTITPTTSTIDGQATYVLNPGHAARIVSDGTNYQVATTGGKQTLPTRQVLTSGSGTYTTPANAVSINVRMLGGGGGGAGSGTTPGAAGDGGNTTFSTITGAGGAKGTTAGGAATGGSCTGSDINIAGGNGGPSISTANQWGGVGGGSAFGGAGTAGGPGTIGAAAKTNSGSGGGGGGINATPNTGGGGAAGAYCETRINSPAGTYSYGVGAAGTAGTAGTSGFAGGAGGSGIVIVDEYYN